MQCALTSGALAAVPVHMVVRRRVQPDFGIHVHLLPLAIGAHEGQIDTDAIAEFQGLGKVRQHELMRTRREHDGLARRQLDFADGRSGRSGFANFYPGRSIGTDPDKKARPYSRPGSPTTPITTRYGCRRRFRKPERKHIPERCT
jgi:hypothetical protein